MNKNFILELADRLDDLAGQPIDGMSEFDMRDFVLDHGCGTAGCIAGAAVALAIEKGEMDVLDITLFTGSVPDEAQRLMGLDKGTANSLFYASWGEGYASDEHDAADQLRALVAGNARWHMAWTDEDA